MKTLSFLRQTVLFWIALAVCQAVSADEGMWLFNDLPRDYLKTKYGFEPTDEWTRHVMLSCVRFNSGGSASFISGTGLVLTNHHVGADTLHKISDARHNYLRDGFHAKTPAEEIKAPDLELNQLVAIEDVTERVGAAVTAEMSAAEAFAARRAVMSKIEKQSLDATGLRSDVVTLYGGARYHLYRYKKYTDVRLVWAPEAAVAAFGGDADNFEYPRYCLDVCLFRVYTDGKPVKIDHFLKLSPKNVVEGELIFMPGNPGSTQRIFTVAALKFQRDRYVPFVLNLLHRQEILYQQYALDGDEQRRQVRRDMLGVQNARKAYSGILHGLQDPACLAHKQAEEAALRAKVQSDPHLKPYADAWKTIEETQARRVKLLGKTASFAAKPYDIAQTLVFMAAEDQKPNSKRLREYRESARASLEQQLFSPAPIHADLERAKLADSLGFFVEQRGGDDPLARKVLDGKSPQARAAELIAGTKLIQIAERRRLAQGGRAAVDASTDPMIELAKLMEPEARRIREIEDELDELERQAYAQITSAVYAIKGTSTYPDATFTLRLAFGQVKGYVENGRIIPPWTTVGGAFEHEKKHGAKEPWKLPRRWNARRGKLNLETPFNFVSTADIIGGNSGSPVINRDAELVGVVFDGNIQSLTGRHYYSDQLARAVSVTSNVIVEALKKIYDAERLVEELAR
ncbi:MAG: S46 family peptidase [Pirellulales bacterium]|nr:S46 family peptidase [Pirellulales bacterium]